MSKRAPKPQMSKNDVALISSLPECFPGRSYIETFSQDSDCYLRMIDGLGLKGTWDVVLHWLRFFDLRFFERNVVAFQEMGRLYERGLAYQNKKAKKSCGQYYTPSDVSDVMARLFYEKWDGDGIVDAGCGCGNLTIAVLAVIKKKNPTHFHKIFADGLLYLYDSDPIAMDICKERIAVYFGADVSRCRFIVGDFLSAKTLLPNDCAVIANPPYNIVKDFDSCWECGDGFAESKDLYIGFFEKILTRCKTAVVVSPQSFLVGASFKAFRKRLGSHFSGEIFAFDNVPCTLFSGRKLGVFNTNSANGVRGAITALVRNESKPGFRITHLLRFSADQREKVLRLPFLKSQLMAHRQSLEAPLKCFKGPIENFMFDILGQGGGEFQDLLSEEAKDDSFSLYVNSSARYFIVGVKRKLKRTGMFQIRAKDKASFYKAYALLNSSYCYAWYRAMDGGILLPKSLLLRIPLPKELKIDEGTAKLIDRMISLEGSHLHYKKNGGTYQESVKFPSSLREELNLRLFGPIDFSPVHSNREATEETHGR